MRIRPSLNMCCSYMKRILAVSPGRVWRFLLECQEKSSGPGALLISVWLPFLLVICLWNLKYALWPRLWLLLWFLLDIVKTSITCKPWLLVFVLQFCILKARINTVWADIWAVVENVKNSRWILSSNIKELNQNHNLCSAQQLPIFRETQKT